MNWYIGQKIVCIDDVPARGINDWQLKKGDVYTIQALRTSGCRCKDVEISVGHVRPEIGRHCLYDVGCKWCGCSYMESNSERFYSNKRFAPLEAKPELSEHTDETIIEELEILLTPNI